MTTFIVVVVLVIVGAVVWNKFTATAAMNGVSFVVPYAPSTVAAALDQSHNRGAAAAIRQAVGGVSLVPSGSGILSAVSKYGDEGVVQISRDPAGSLVQAHATRLYIGAPPKMIENASGGIWGLSVALTHGLYRLIGVAPGAAFMKRWEHGLESRINKAIAKATR